MTTVFTLPNGIRCVHEERPGTEQVIVRLAIHSGSANEKLEESGLTNLTQEATNGGTKNWSREQLTNLSEGVAANLISMANDTMTVFGFNAFKKDAADIFPLMADMVLNPAYDPKEVERTRAEIKRGIMEAGQSPANVAGLLYGETVFSGQAAGMPSFGSEETLASFTVEQVKAKHADLISRPEDIVISFGGDIDLETAKSLATQYFSGLQATGEPRVRPVIKFTPGDARIEQKNEHLNLNLGFEAPGLHNPERPRFAVLDELLSGGMTSPLPQEIREKRSLAYSVGSSYSLMEGTGAFTIFAGTGKGNARVLITETINLLGRIARDGFSDEEIAQAKAGMLRSAVASLERTESVVNSNFSTLLLRGRVVSLREMEARYRDISNDDIRNACADLLRSGNYALAGVGPQDEMPTPDEIKAMMVAQLEGLVLLPKRPAQELLTTEFSIAAHDAKADAASEPKMTVLPNGLKIITVEKPGTLSAGMWIGVGSGNEAPGMNGARHMNEHMMFKGTPNYPAGTIMKKVKQDMGGGLNAYTGKDQTAYYFYNLLSEDMDEALAMLGDMVFDASIGGAEYAGGEVMLGDGTKEVIAGERAVVLEEIKRANDKIGSRILYALDSTNYPGQPHGRTTLGTEDSLMAISAADLRADRAEYYTPNNVVVCVTGPVKHEAVVKAVEKKLGAKTPGRAAELSVPVFHGGVGSVEMQNAKVVNAYFALESVGLNDPASQAYELLGKILSAGHSSRLYRELSSEQDLLKDIGIFNYTLPNSGRFIVSLSCDADNLKPILSGIYSEIARIPEDLSEDELVKVKAMTKAQLIAGLEKNSSVCDWYGQNAIAAGRLVTPAEEMARIDAVTVADIKRLANKLLLSKPALSLVVPPETDPQLIPDYNELIGIRNAVRGVEPIIWIEPEEIAGYVPPVVLDELSPSI